MNSTAKSAAIARVAPQFKRAAELQEEVLSQLVPLREMQGEMLEKARLIGTCLEQAALALRSSGVDVTYEEALSAHAPNIPPKQADKYRRYSRGELNQLYLWDDPRPRQIGDGDCERTPAKPWVQAWGYLARFGKVAQFDSWPQEQVDLTRQELEPIAKRLWPERFGV